MHRVGQRHLDFYSGYRKKFKDPRGVAAVKLAFNDEQGAGDDFELTVYGVNAGTNEVFYNKSMVSLGFYGSEAVGETRLNNATAICCDALGNVFVADTGNDRVVHLINVDNELGFNSAFNLAASGRVLRAPQGVALDDGVLLVSDTGNDRIVECGLDGSLRRVMVEPGRTRGPTAIDLIAGPEFNFHGVQMFVVVDSSGQRLAAYDLDGTRTAAVNYGEVTGGSGRFGYVAIDYHANVYVTDAVEGCIFMLDRNLNYVTRIGCDRRGGDRLDEPRGIALYRRFGQLFVAERKGASYFWVGSDVENLSCRSDQSDEQVIFDVRFLLTQHSTVTINLETSDGETVETLANDVFMPLGYLSKKYRVATSDLPCPLANCKYQVTVSARATYSSRPYHRVTRSARVR